MKWMTIVPLHFAGTYPLVRSMGNAVAELPDIKHDFFYCDEYLESYRRLFSSCSSITREQLDGLVHSHANLMFLERLLKLRPDYIFLSAFSVIFPEFLGHARNIGTKIVYWHLEDHRYSSAIKIAPNWSDYISEVDVFLSFESGEALQKFAQANPAATIAYMPLGYDARTFRPGPISDSERAQHESQVVFCGAPYPNRVDFFNSLNDSRIHLWGRGWKESGEFYGHRKALKPNVARAIRGGGERFSAEAENKIYNAGKIGLNIHSCLTGTSPLELDGWFVNPRTFSMPGSGIMQICDNRRGVSDFFEPGKEIILYDSVEECRDRVDYFLAHDKERLAIAEAGHKRARSDHSFDSRIQSMFELL
jgi:spore maturation protein CgeB